MKTYTFPLIGRPINLVVRIGHGKLTVDARDDLTEATVMLTVRDPDLLERVTVEMRGDTLHVSSPRQGGLADLVGGWRKGDAIDVVVVVPTGTASKLATATADITVTGTIGVSDIATGNATIDLTTVAGDLRVRYGNGETRVGDVTGSVSLKAGRGEIRIGRVSGALHSRTGSGSVSIEAIHGDLDLATGSGSFTIGVPDGVSVRLDVTTGSGLLHSDLPVEHAPKPGARAVTLRARTGSGDVRLVRARAA